MANGGFSCATVMTGHKMILYLLLGAWLVTGGTHHGAMKDVGDTIHNFRLMSASNQNVVAIGIASWGCIQDKEMLIRHKSMAISDSEV